MYLSPSGPPEFGDVYSADWLYDAYLRGDAVALHPTTLKGGALGYTPAQASQTRDLVLAHGKPCLAILLADDCEIETLLRRGHESRLPFAAILPWPPTAREQESARTTAAFRRHPLEPHDDFIGGIIELQRLFAVSAEAVSKAEEQHRLARLDSTSRVKLEIRWNAYTTRRGPRTHLDNAEKLARLITANGNTGTLDQLRAGSAFVPGRIRDAALKLADTLGMAWNIEGAELNRVGDALETCDASGPYQERLADALLELSAQAAEAAEAIRGARTR